MQKFFFYIARCKDQSLYCGSTNNPEKRIVRHNKGQGARWFRDHGSGTIVYTEAFDTLAEARRREAQVKKWSRKKKENLIKGSKPIMASLTERAKNNIILLIEN